MALIPEDEFPGKITAATPEYPLGSARNITTAGDGKGTPLKASWLNDLFGFQQALLAEAGITANGNPDQVGASQYLDALQTLFQPTVLTTHVTFSIDSAGAVTSSNVLTDKGGRAYTLSSSTPYQYLLNPVLNLPSGQVPILLINVIESSSSTFVAAPYTKILTNNNVNVAFEVKGITGQAAEVTVQITYEIPL